VTGVGDRRKKGLQMVAIGLGAAAVGCLFHRAGA
jgi:VIT1/CCC1 family predicted Fe2+/Mn2+ transporter